MSGPTLNEEYNKTFANWLKTNPNTKPECEDCEGDLTGRKVKETEYGWFCVPCRNEQIRNPIVFCDEAKAERRQMGFSGL